MKRRKRMRRERKESKGEIVFLDEQVRGVRVSERKAIQPRGGWGGRRML